MTLIIRFRWREKFEGFGRVPLPEPAYECQFAALRDEDLVLRGEAWVNHRHVTWPSASLLVSRDQAEMSASHSWFGAVAVKSRRTRSSRTGGPAFLPLRPRFLPNALHQPMDEQIRHAVRSAIDRPASRASSAKTGSRTPDRRGARRTTRSLDMPARARRR